MKRTKLTAALVSVAMSLTTLVGCTNPSAKVRIGTAGEGGVYHSYGNALCEIFHTVSPNTTFEAKDTAGSAANLRLLSDDYLELAITQSDVADEAYHGTGIFQDNPRTGYSAVASLYTEACQIVVRADSAIQTMDDLLGKRISVGEEDSGALYNAVSILECCGLTLDMLDVQHLPYTDAAQALSDGTIDAFFCTAGAPVQTITDLADRTPIRLLSLEPHQVERLLTTSPSYLPTTVPAHTYAGQESDAATVGVRAVLVANDNLSTDAVYQYLSAIYENQDFLQTETAADTALELTDAASGVTIPWHPGAIRFYEEHNFEIGEG